MRFLPLAIVFAFLGAGTAAHAEVFIDHVFPPSFERGIVNRVRLRGSRLSGATGLWTSLPRSQLTARQIADSVDGEAVFEIELTDEVPLGLYGLRVATRDGLSNVHLFAIDDLRTVAEAETTEARPNNKLEQAQQVSLPVSIIGTCRSSDVDHFVIEVQQGQRVAFEVVGNRLGKGFDPVLMIFDDQGNFITERDNDVGLFFDCRFEHTFDQSGRFIVRLHDTRFLGSPHWTYLLRMGDFPIARVALPSTGPPGGVASVHFPQAKSGPHEVVFPDQLDTRRFFFELRGHENDSPAWLPLAVSEFENVVESEPNETPQQPNLVPVPCNIHGKMDQVSDWDFFALELKKGQRIAVRSDTRDMGSAADLELTLMGPDGKTLKTVDDTGFDDAAFEFTARADGRHLLKVLEVVRKHGPEYVYRIEVHERTPAVELTSQIGRIAIPQGSWQPLPLQLSYTDFAGPVDLALIGAPAGLHLRDTTVEEGAQEFAGALVADESTPPGIYTLQVVATAQKDDRSIRAVATAHPLIDRLPTGRGPHGEPFELREDQRRLPPSVTDRLAVVVIPSVPFDFEISTPEVILPRYLHTEFLIETTRVDGFTDPIEFVARGGLLEYKQLQMPSVLAEIPTGSSDRHELTATLSSGVNTSLTKHLVTVTGTAQQGLRTINLTRTFQLEVKVAYAPSVDPPKLELPPGGSARVRLHANRLKPFDGELKVRPSQQDGIDLPEELVVPAGQDSIDVEVKVSGQIKPGTYKIKLPGSARIDKFFEEGAGDPLEIVVKTQDDVKD